MKKTIKLFVLIAIVGMALVGCQKENMFEPEKQDRLGQDNFVIHGCGNTSDIGEEWTLELPKKGSRSYFWLSHLDPESPAFIESGEAFVEGSSKKYVTMKVKRSEAIGDYFYVMLENLNIPGNKYGEDYIAYDYDNEYAEKYGYLYSWYEAKKLLNKVYMKLPLIWKGEEYTGVKIKRRGRLPSREDLSYIFEQSVPFLPEQMDGLTPTLFYYDAFVAGLTEEDKSEYTTVGYADNMKYWHNYPYPYNHQSFFEKGILGSFWTSNSDNDCAFPLMITNEYNDGDNCLFRAFINVARSKDFGMSVRYVFYPNN